jgi:PilZ domain-containing protein
VSTPTLERRRHARYPATFKVRCARIGREGEPDEVDAVDVSRSGLRMIAPRGVTAGDVLSLVLNPAQPVHTTGIVVTCRPAFDVRGRREAHIAFTKVTADVERELDRLIAAARGDHASAP